MEWRTKATALRDGNGLVLGIDRIDAVEENDLHPDTGKEVGNARGIEIVNATETGTILTVTERENGKGIVPEAEETVWNANESVTTERENRKSRGCLVLGINHRWKLRTQAVTLRPNRAITRNVRIVNGNANRDADAKANEIASAIDAKSRTDRDTKISLLNNFNFFVRP